MGFVRFIETEMSEDDVVRISNIKILSDCATISQLATTWGGQLHDQRADDGDCTCDLFFKFSSATAAAIFYELLTGVPVEITTV